MTFASVDWCNAAAKLDPTESGAMRVDRMFHFVPSVRRFCFKNRDAADWGLPSPSPVAAPAPAPAPAAVAAGSAASGAAVVSSFKSERADLRRVATLVLASDMAGGQQLARGEARRVNNSGGQRQKHTYRGHTTKR